MGVAGRVGKSIRGLQGIDMRPLMRSSRRGRRMGRMDVFGFARIFFSWRVNVCGKFYCKPLSDCLFRLYKWVGNLGIGVGKAS